jgi:tetraacyldisaccharide 4'-kinase
MIDHWLLKWLLIPVSLLCGIVVAAKNALYRVGFLTGVRFSIPVIGVGNLTVGGSGKTPHVEYLIRLLRPYLHTAVMSRGYGRATPGFIFVQPGHNSEQVGDEALIYARKYRDVAVAVSESRSVGIPLLLQRRSSIQTVLLDDAFQHRSVRPYLNMLLTPFHAPYYRDWLLPVGRLREWRTSARRADIVIVTKCPADLSPVSRDEAVRHIRPATHQRVYFTAYQYRQPYAMYPSITGAQLPEIDGVLLVCGIATPDDLIAYAESRYDNLDILAFGDHHVFGHDDLLQIRQRLLSLSGNHKIILTTEKDAVRLERHAPFIAQHRLPVFILPVEVVFLFDDGPAFDDHVRQLLLDFKI